MSDDIATKYLVEAELIEQLRGIRLYIPLWIDAAGKEQAASVAELFRRAFVSSGYEIGRLSEPRRADAHNEQFLHDLVSAYTTDRPTSRLEWSLVVRPEAAKRGDDQKHSVRDAVMSVARPFSAVVINGDASKELRSVVVSLP
jgi:hypothetical protein